jgi:hypothetical protein
MSAQGNYRWESQLKEFVAPMNIGEIHKEFQSEITNGMDYVGDPDTDCVYNVM